MTKMKKRTAQDRKIVEERKSKQDQFLSPDYTKRNPSTVERKTPRVVTTRIIRPQGR